MDQANTTQRQVVAGRWRPHCIVGMTMMMVSVMHREWAGNNPRATVKTPIIVEDLLSWRMVAYPFRLLQDSFLRP